MLKVENCICALVANLLFAVLLQSPSVNSYHSSYMVGDPLSFSRQQAVGHEFT